MPGLGEPTKSLESHPSHHSAACGGSAAMFNRNAQANMSETTCGASLTRPEIGSLWEIAQHSLLFRDARTVLYRTSYHACKRASVQQQRSACESRLCGDYLGPAKANEGATTWRLDGDEGGERLALNIPPAPRLTQHSFSSLRRRRTATDCGLLRGRCFIDQ